MKLSADMDSMSSKWTALLDMCGNITAQRLLSALPPLVLCRDGAQPENIKAYVGERRLGCESVCRKVCHLLLL